MDLERDRRRKPTPDTSIFQFSGDKLIRLLYDEENICIPEFCRTIGICAFADNLYAERIVIPPSVRTIDSGAFWGCLYLRELELSEGLEEIRDCAFQDTAIAQVKFPSSLKRIEEAAFNGCPLETLMLPEGLEEVSLMAFGECSQLHTVTIPDSLTDLDEDAFYRCDNLRRIQASPSWQQGHPELCRQLARQLKDNFRRKAGEFCRRSDCPLPAEAQQALDALEPVEDLDVLQTAMDAIAEDLRQKIPQPQKTRILRNAIRCLDCGEVLESLYRHDFRMCRCGSCGVDGGLDYLRRLGDPGHYAELAEEESLPPDPLL